MNWAGKKILVLGLGESGLAMARWGAYCGASVCVADTRDNPDRLQRLQAELPQVGFRSGPFTTEGLTVFDIVAVSPGLRPDVELKEILPFANEHGIPVWSEIEMFAQALKDLEREKQYRPKIIAVTGTNGKTTVTSLTGHMCRRAGKTVCLAGNISPAALDVLLEMVRKDQLPDVWVLELSSFQLFATYRLEPDAATVLNLTQDHLDWHGSMAAYGAAKERIFGRKTVQVLNREDGAVMKMRKPGAPVLTFGTDEPVEPDAFGMHSDRGIVWLAVMSSVDDGIVRKNRKNPVPVETVIRDLMPADALKIRGRHNAGNALAALALCRAIGLPFAPLLQALKDYRGEPHRVELVATVNEVAYIDDSKGTNVGATVAAVRGLGENAGNEERKIILIAGGLGKDQDFSPLSSVVGKYVKAVMLIGKDAVRIHDALAPAGVRQIYCDSLEEAVVRASEVAKQNDMVLLSPACASMDMFRNYAHRSEVFVTQVRRLGGAAGGGATS
ncbi:UDP-N-acetylmuramoyl-L-alanine--D-glutamate ligase [Oxalobacter aliiformigenes]|uniref:UDP-N-acetylmuramoyl-L-alanine--D-glutamate ligase n=1 Tax=Oxalobacter aliiformigenes TaxID=2946593 RepID=UPI0022AE6625|nr:UDP-N-acetylmuramoyl-L-alanine--D-glutamate ligase [Oxalobacter aliiformigenes]WAV89589.1 UDP-N-acetylmuramoyl-L-alanine--D-glutamate ligase [Oxalobacter aliiformigenes]